MKRILVTLFVLSVLATLVNAQNNSNLIIYNKLQQYLAGTDKTNLNAVISKTAQFFLKTPYVGHTLDLNSEETLVVNLNKFDCVTFVESVVALSKNYVSDSANYSNFERILQNIRYRHGIINGYTSRLHYTSDWIFDNILKHNVVDCTAGLGGEKFCPKLNFMTTHTHLYAQLKNSAANVDSMRIIENQINQRKGLYYIPKNKVADIEKNIESGDIILITTSISGIDYAHVGFAFNENGVLKFLHASSTQKQVTKTASWLHLYLLDIKNFTGISVLRAISK